ncbi:30S ribosomal protein S16 [Aggregatimonas sangjinii]|uniref:Small ribosomal subunit protein bS16 n=1 Tax=Aggregatimonas sangjinii TaxID=2583587 RepID=A0A5B7SVL6_9FLAO|nr:30S ribosomal protein S16 [Aggregatimonas sangjinii]
MPVKIRLQRHGKKGKPFYWIVAADSRAKRDGKYLEKLGTYNPNTNPATIDLNLDHSVQWLQNGAQPTDTARAILSYKGVMMKHHLLGGLRKGALTEEQVEEKFNAWMEQKAGLVAAKVGGLDKKKAEAKAAALKAEKEVNEKRALAAAEAELPETPEAVDAEEEVEALDDAPKPEADIPQSENTEGSAAAEPETEAVVETPEVPQPDADNADHTPVAPVVEEEVVEANDDMKKAPSVEEVMENSDEEVKPAPSAEEE